MVDVNYHGTHIPALSEFSSFSSSLESPELEMLDMSPVIHQKIIASYKKT